MSFLIIFNGVTNINNKNYICKLFLYKKGSYRFIFVYYLDVYTCMQACFSGQNDLVDSRIIQHDKCTIGKKIVCRRTVSKGQIFSDKT